MAFERQAKLSIVHKSLKIIKLIKNAIHLTLSLITFVLLVFSFSAAYEWIRLTFLFILLVFEPKILYFEGFNVQF